MLSVLGDAAKRDIPDVVFRAEDMLIVDYFASPMRSLLRW